MEDTEAIEFSTLIGHYIDTTSSVCDLQWHCFLLSTSSLWWTNNVKVDSIVIKLLHLKKSHREIVTGRHRRNLSIFLLLKEERQTFQTKQTKKKNIKTHKVNIYRVSGNGNFQVSKKQTDISK